MRVKKIISFGAALVMALVSVPMTASAESETKKVRVIVENNTFAEADGAAWEGTLLDMWVTVGSGSTMKTAIIDALDSEGLRYNIPDYGYGAYIADIADLGETTYAVQEGCYPGWSVSLNDWFTSSGIDYYTVDNGTLIDGDVIDVMYSVTSEDVGNVYYSNDTTLKSVTFSTGSLDKEFSPEETSYELTLGEADSLSIIPTANNKIFQVKIFKNSYTPELPDAAYKSGEELDAADGDVIYIGVGNEHWQSSYYGSEPVTETVYEFTLRSGGAQDVSKVEEVKALIEAIGEVTLESEADIVKARTEYQRLRDDLKALVDNLDVLEAAEKKLAELKSSDAPANGFDDMFRETSDAIASSEPKLGSEWRMIGLARSGRLTDEAKKAYLAELAKLVADSENGKLHARRSTENSKASLAAAALGIDPAKLAGKDILAPLNDPAYTSVQGISGELWAEIALTAVGKDSAYTEALLEAQLQSGAFTFDGKTEDIDITAMIVTALAKNNSAADAIDRAVEWLASKQQPDGSYGSCESTAQVIIALSSIGTDCTKDERFIKNGNSLMDGLSVYYLGNGAFSHDGAAADAMASEQAYLALVSYYRLANGMTALYDLSDVSLSAYDAAPAPTEPITPDNTPSTGSEPLVFIVIALSAAAVCISRRSRETYTK